MNNNDEEIKKLRTTLAQSRFLKAYGDIARIVLDDERLTEDEIDQTTRDIELIIKKIEMGGG